MKFRYFVDDIASLLTEFYIQYRNLNIPSQKQSIMKLHVKQAMSDTFHYLYDPVDDIYCITIFDKPSYIRLTFGYDIDFDRNVLDEFIHIVHNQFAKIFDPDSDITINNPDDLISIQVTPFDDFSITLADITQLLDLDCV